MLAGEVTDQEEVGYRDPDISSPSRLLKRNLRKKTCSCNHAVVSVMVTNMVSAFFHVKFRSRG